MHVGVDFFRMLAGWFLTCLPSPKRSFLGFLFELFSRPALTPTITRSPIKRMSKKMSKVVPNGTELHTKWCLISGGEGRVNPHPRPGWLLRQLTVCHWPHDGFQQKWSGAVNL